MEIISKNISQKHGEGLLPIIQNKAIKWDIRQTIYGRSIKAKYKIDLSRYIYLISRMIYKTKLIIIYCEIIVNNPSFIKVLNYILINKIVEKLVGTEQYIISII